MQMIQRFMDGMLILTNEVVAMKDIGYETLWMDMDEVDENIIPNNIITALGNPIITWYK